jgi:rhodanese-related sulfurtransferase
MGHTKVAVYNEGLPEWVKRGYPAEIRKIYPRVDVPLLSAAELKTLLDEKAPVFVLDVREEDDVRAGRIASSTNIDLEELDSRLGDVPKGPKIVVVDLHGKQTNVAARFLAWKGYRDVARLDGGFVGGWVRAGYPIAR